MHKQILTFVLISGSSILMARRGAVVERQRERALEYIGAQMLKQWGVVTNLQLRRSADRCAGITWCDVDVDRSRDILTNEAELWLIHLAHGHALHYLLFLITLYSFNIVFLSFVPSLLSYILTCALKFANSLFFFVFLFLCHVSFFFLFFLHLLFLPPLHQPMLSHSILFVFTLLSSFFLSCTLSQCSQIARNQISGFSISFLLIPT